MIIAGNNDVQDLTIINGCMVDCTCCKLDNLVSCAEQEEQHIIWRHCCMQTLASCSRVDQSV